MMPPPDKNTSVFLDSHIDRSTWKRVRLSDLFTFGNGYTPSKAEPVYWGNGTIPWFRMEDIRANGHILKDSIQHISQKAVNGRGLFPAGSYILSTTATLGEYALLIADSLANQRFTFLVKKVNRADDIDEIFFLHQLAAIGDWCRKSANAGGLLAVNMIDLKNYEFSLPPAKDQRHIARSLSSIETHISALQALIAKYEAIKKAPVNLLLEPKAGWKRMKLDEICMCLDNYRKPVNEVERAGMQGDIPYCGANGIVDYVNDFTIDDSIILIAEDGGYFDQYESRPIAYRMSGKAWINNHAHILKAKSDYCQAFIFYSLEHKDITPFITSGTRAKLTKGELSNIEIDTPSSFQEQRKIAEQITAIDNVLADYKAQLEKARQLKAGMMSYFFG